LGREPFFAYFILTVASSRLVALRARVRGVQALQGQAWA